MAFSAVIRLEGSYVNSRERKSRPFCDSISKR
jgi:hypothetical protein